MDLDAEIALNAALLSANLKIPMVDSVILATAQKYNAVLWTQDIHHDRLPNVRSFPKNSSSYDTTLSSPVRPHAGLGKHQTPSMAIGLYDRRISMLELLSFWGFSFLTP